MEKLFTVAGTSSLEGVVKFRVANGSAAARTKVLVRSGHTEILLQDLPKGMTKEDAFAFVKANGGAVAAKAPKDKLVEAVKREGRAAPKQKTVKMATIVKKVSKKFIAAREAEFAALSKRAVEADRNFAKAAADAGVEATLAAQPSANSINEIAKIKAKNLETMRRVTNKLAALRSY